MIAIAVFITGIILAGMAHWCRDSYAWQDGDTLFWQKVFPLIPISYFQRGGWRDLWHRTDTFVRLGVAMIGGGAVLIPVPWYLVPAFFLCGLWASEWLFAIMYHVIGVPDGHVDKRTLWQQIKSMIPFLRSM